MISNSTCFRAMREIKRTVCVYIFTAIPYLSVYLWRYSCLYLESCIHKFCQRNSTNISQPFQIWSFSCVGTLRKKNPNSKGSNFDQCIFQHTKKPFECISTLCLSDLNFFSSMEKSHSIIENCLKKPIRLSGFLEIA